MKRIALFCVTAALIACGAGRSEAPPTTTSATVRPDAGPTLEPAPRGHPEPVWSPSPQPGSSQMPFDPRGFTTP
jgi:hypothetical protein